METFLLLDLRTFFLSPTSQLSSFLPPSSWRSLFKFQPYPTAAKLLYSSSPNLCRRHGTSLAGSYSSSLKSSIPLPFFCGEHLAFVTFPFRFTFISAIKPFGIASFPLSFTHSSSSGWPSLPIDVQAMLLRNRLSFL